ncbi:hypothetical protein [Pseudoduganella violacea]|uniref:Mg2+ and Co2+ transporter CorA n=1 Tax=Pseudoduganella violacea TaxID=1715466 RepID=A0A7W5B982_9BURK|nr:hypothetical protein [Pseudoduganella violacea]MBB3118869.1 Mg2+ and Co2+ transporter CorA [Pseudoduganella violacea]
MSEHLPPPQLDRPKSPTEDEKTETRLTRVETIVDYLAKAIERLERRMDDGFTALRTEHRADIAELRQELNEFRKEVATHMRWLLGIVFASFMSLLAMMAKINNLL